MVSVDVRETERESIRRFVETCADLLIGRVLDYGCGQAPFAPLVEAAGGDWHGYDRARFPANVSAMDVGPDDPLFEAWDAILCTQVMQYVPYLGGLLKRFADALKPRSGALVLTYPTNWPVVETADLWRFTPSGISLLLEDAGFAVERIEMRGTIMLEGGMAFPLGGGVVARA